MNMVFCRGCGKQIHETAPTCPGCGASQVVGNDRSSAQGAEAISPSWEGKFALIDKAGGVKMPQLKNLAFGERMKAIFNVWGFLFGPIYYLAKGMWKKALSLLGVAVLIVMVAQLLCRKFGLPETITNYVGSAMFACRANIDYYKKMKLGDNGWW